MFQVSRMLWIALLAAIVCSPASASGASQAVPGTLVLITSIAPTLHSAGQTVLWRATPDGTATRLLARAGATALSSPALSPDGRHIAYVVDSRSLWTMNLDGSHAARLHEVPAGSADVLSGPPTKASLR